MSLLPCTTLFLIIRNFSRSCFVSFLYDRVHSRDDGTIHPNLFHQVCQLRVVPTARENSHRSSNFFLVRVMPVIRLGNSRNVFIINSTALSMASIAKRRFVSLSTCSRERPCWRISPGPDAGQTEIRDAKRLWGKEIGESRDMIQEELKDRTIRTDQIGPAGERLVRYACIINDVGYAAGRTGLGAVMSSKNLKAIATKGHERVKVADPGAPGTLSVVQRKHV